MAGREMPPKKVAKAVKTPTPRHRGEKVDGEAAVLAKIALIPQPYRGIAAKLHATIRANAPGLTPRTWYGLPAYANKDGDVVVFFRGPQVFKERYLTLGFNDSANLDEGPMWAVQFALTQLTASDEARVADLIRKAVA